MKTDTPTQNGTGSQGLDSPDVGLHETPGTQPDQRPLVLRKTRPQRFRAFLRRRRLAIALALAALAAAGAALWFFVLREEPPPPPAAVRVDNVAGVGEAIVITAGTTTPAQLAAQVGDASVLSHSGQVTNAALPIVLGAGGELAMIGGELRLQSQPGSYVGLVVDGGHLNVSGAILTSWDGTTFDRDYSDGRAYLRAESGSIDIANTRIVGLGSGDLDEPGVSLSGGVSGSIDDLLIVESYTGLKFVGRFAKALSVDRVTVVSPAFVGVEFATASGLAVADVSVQESGGSGFIISGSSSDLVLDTAEAAASAADGFSVTGTAGDVIIRNSRSFRNEFRGFAVANTRGITLDNNTIWANTGGVVLTGPNAATEIINSSISGNRGGGIEIASAGSSANIEYNVLDHNEFGVLVTDGSATMRGNTVINNGDGVSILDSSPSVSLTQNAIEDNYDAGVRFKTADGIEMTRNAVLRNAHAAFVVDFVESSEPFWDTNDVDAGRYGIEQLYTPLADAADLADITPIPSYFFLETDRAFADVEVDE